MDIYMHAYVYSYAYISRRCNSWVPFRVQKLAILGTQIQIGVSQRVFIPSRASKYMLESKRESLRKWKKIWSWATSFWSFCNFKKYAIYIFYIYALRDYSGWWSCPTSKIFFSENSLVYMLYIWHNGRIMKPSRKWYFWSFLCPKIAFFVIFAQMCPKKGEDLNGRHNFFCICRLARLKIYVRGLLLYFQKNKKFLKLTNFSRTYACI